MYFSKKMWIYNSIPFYSVQIFWSQDYIFSKSCIWTKNFWPQSLLSTKVEPIPNVSSAWGHEARKLRVILTKLVRQHSWRQQTVNSHLSSDTDFQEKFSSLINTKTGTKSCVYNIGNLQTKIQREIERLVAYVYSTSQFP